MFEELRGNEQVKSMLARVVTQGRVPQSLLFSGPDGVGKKLFALELAKALVCNSLKNGGPCGTCSACVRSEKFKLPKSEKKEDYLQVFFSEHPDVGMLVPNKNTIYVDAIRALAEEANYRPFEASSRVFIIDQAEKLGLTQKAAANALLKTLEEPPPTTHLILVTSRPSAILQTIHSRCHKLRFSGVSESEIVELLKSSKEMPSEDTALAAKVADGSIALALSFDVDSYKELRGRILEVVHDAIEIRGFRSAHLLSERMSTLKERDGYSKALEVVEILVRDLFLILSRNPEGITNIDIKEDLMALAKNAKRNQVAYWLEEIEGLKSRLRFNLNKRVAADALFVKMGGMR